MPFHINRSHQCRTVKHFFNLFKNASKKSDQRKYRDHFDHDINIAKTNTLRPACLFKQL